MKRTTEQLIVRAAMILWKYEPVNSAEVGYSRRYDRLMKLCARAKREKERKK